MITEKILAAIRAKAKKIKEAEKKFLGSLVNIEIEVEKAVLKLLKKFSTKDGKLNSDDSTTALIRRLNKEITNIVNRSNYQNAIDELLPNYELIETLNKDIYKGIVDDNVLLNVSPVRNELVKDITAALANQSSLNAQFIKPIKKTLLQAVSFGHTFEDAEKNLRSLITGEGKKLGRFSQYAGQVVRDGLLQWDGAINDKLKDEYDFEFFRYVGTDVKDSRENCLHMRDGTGWFEDLAVSPGVYRVADIPKIINRGRGRKGFNPAVTPSNFASIRFGYNCRDVVIYF